MPPELAEVRRWLTKAGHDWSAVRKIFTPDCQETGVAAFHCQQAVEKTLKAYLVSRGVEFEKIHDLRRLLDYCVGVDQTFDSLREADFGDDGAVVRARAGAGTAARARQLS
jgi:HEPN domain-containing protein